MLLDAENLAGIADAFIGEQLVKEDKAEMTGWFWFGSEMNDIYSLHGENRYPDDLPFLSFENDSFDGNGSLSTFKMISGARWLDDIVQNNRLNEENL